MSKRKPTNADIEGIKRLLLDVAKHQKLVPTMIKTPTGKFRRTNKENSHVAIQ